MRSTRARRPARTMDAILKLGERLKNLKARISAARQAGDNETANRLVDVHNKHVRQQEAMIAENVCRLQFEIVGGGWFLRDHAARRLCHVRH